MNAKAPDCSGAFYSREAHPSREGMSVLATAHRRRSHGTGPRTSVVLTRWIHRAAFVGAATRARPCCHPFFMLRFLAGCSARANGSSTGRARRGLGLSRRNERRAEQRHNDKSRGGKFGSHQNISVGYWNPPNLGDAIQFRRGANIAQISYSKSPFASSAQAFTTFPSIRHLPNIGFAQSTSNGAFAYWGYAVFVDVIKGSPRCPKCEEMMALRIIEPERPGYDLLTFECPKCLGTETLVVSIY
jgi:hypothetical protein